MKKILLLILIFVFVGFWGCEKNHPPEIVEINHVPSSGVGGTIFTLTVQAVDEDRDQLTYLWSCDGGEIIEGSTSTQAKWGAPISLSNETYSIKVSVSDGVESITRSTQIQVGKTETGSISGNVYFAGCTIPISGVTIEITGKTATTGSEGRYSITEVPIGKHSIKATKTDYDQFSQEVVIESNKNTELIVPMTSQRYSTKVYGTVRGDYSGMARSGATVLVFNPDGSESELKTTTSSTGYYQLPSVPQGQRTLAVLEYGKIVFTAEVFLADTDYPFDISIPEPFEFTDSRDDNKYYAYKIGTQTWMIENLAYLPSVSSGNTGSDSEKHYYVYDYNGTSVSEAKSKSNYTRYGVLYNWPAAMNGESSGGQVQGVCPSGWHLPSDAEWTILTDYLTNNGYGYGGSGSDIGKAMASTSGWSSSSEAGDVGNDQASNNSSGFNALPGGYRGTHGGFYYLGYYALFWSSSEYGSSYAWDRHLYYRIDGVHRTYDSRGNGFSVRCLRN